MKVQRSKKRGVYAATVVGLWLVSGCWLTSAQPGSKTQQEMDMSARFLVLSPTCARCHTAVDTAKALWNEDGEDISPVGTWNASVMANSFTDPYWRAQMERERAAAGEADVTAITELCTRCHAPAAIHENRLEGIAPPTLAQLDADPAAHEGVTCTVCHRMNGDGFGEERTFHGNLVLDGEANLYGPYPDPFPGPMANMSGYNIHFGAHMVESALCGTCHTLETGHGDALFLEQSPYLEWRNSIFSHEAGSPFSRSCQDCHMEAKGDTMLAHNPGGGDFPSLNRARGAFCTASWAATRGCSTCCAWDARSSGCARARTNSPRWLPPRATSSAARARWSRSSRATPPRTTCVLPCASRTAPATSCPRAIRRAAPGSKSRCNPAARPGSLRACRTKPVASCPKARTSTCPTTR
ncbi:MAG: multiheme c-type cytochrome [Planctomycetota bacterium]